MNRLSRLPSYAAATALVGVSALMNARYGASLGETDLDKAAWIAASVASDVLKAASPIAILAAWRRRDLLTGVAAVALLGITVSYSASAAVGFSASARAGISGDKQARIEAAGRAQEARQKAKTELAIIGNPQPVAALEAKISGLLADPRSEGCTTINGDYTRKWCPVVAELKIELATAKRKAELEATIANADRVLADAPAGSADPQATAIAAYAEAVGVKVDPKNLQSWLAGLAAALVELGSVFGFLVAGAGGREHQPKPDRPTDIVETPAAIEPPCPVLKLISETGERRQDGRFRISQRRLAEALGEPRRDVAAKLEELASSGKIRLDTNKGGTLVTLH